MLVAALLSDKFFRANLSVGESAGPFIPRLKSAYQTSQVASDSMNIVSYLSRPYFAF